MIDRIEKEISDPALRAGLPSILPPTVEVLMLLYEEVVIYLR